MLTIDIFWNAFVALWLFFLGASFASFFNVIAGGDGNIIKNLKRKRSKCDSCGRVLNSMELIPVLGWVLARGRCKKCKSKITLFHPLTEAVLGFSLVLCYLAFADLQSLIISILFALVLYFFSVYDYYHGIVPNFLVYSLIILMLILRVALFLIVGASPLPYGWGALLYFSFFFVINILSMSGFMPGIKGKKQGFGWGDSKFSIFLGLVLGIQGVLVSLWVSIFAGGFLSVILILKKFDRATKLPYIPIMSIGAFVALLWGKLLWDFLQQIYWIPG